MSNGFKEKVPQPELPKAKIQEIINFVDLLNNKKIQSTNEFVLMNRPKPLKPQEIIGCIPEFFKTEEFTNDLLCIHANLINLLGEIASELNNKLSINIRNIKDIDPVEKEEMIKYAQSSQSKKIGIYDSAGLSLINSNHNNDKYRNLPQNLDYISSSLFSNIIPLLAIVFCLHNSLKQTNRDTLSNHPNFHAYINYLNFCLGLPEDTPESIYKNLVVFDKNKDLFVEIQKLAVDNSISSLSSCSFQLTSVLAEILGVSNLAKNVVDRVKYTDGSKIFIKELEEAAKDVGEAENLDEFIAEVWGQTGQSWSVWQKIPTEKLMHISNLLYFIDPRILDSLTSKPKVRKIFARVTSLLSSSILVNRHVGQDSIEMKGSIKTEISLEKAEPPVTLRDELYSLGRKDLITELLCSAILDCPIPKSDLITTLETIKTNVKAQNYGIYTEACSLLKYLSQEIGVELFYSINNQDYIYPSFVAFINILIESLNQEPDDKLQSHTQIPEFAPKFITDSGQTRRQYENYWEKASKTLREKLWRIYNDVSRYSTFAEYVQAVRSRQVKGYGIESGKLGNGIYHFDLSSACRMFVNTKGVVSFIGNPRYHR